MYPLSLTELHPLFPCCFCDRPTPRYTFYNTTCAFCLMEGQNKMSSLTEKIALLTARRTMLLQQLSALDKELRVAINIATPTKPTFIRLFPCSCGMRFDFFLDRLTHIDLADSDLHRADGEIQNGHHVYHNEDIVGNPPIKKTKLPKLPNRFSSFEDFDDIE